MEDYVPTTKIVAYLECFLVSVLLALQFLAILVGIIVDLFLRAREFVRRILGK